MATSSKRLFVGLPVTLSELGDLEAALKQMRIRADKKKMEIQWTPPSNLHVTLKFLGNTPSERLPDIEDCLAEASRQQSAFSLKFHGAGAFPELRHARVLWAGVQRKRDLVEFQNLLENQFYEKLQWPMEERVFQPHLTLARLHKKREVQDLISSFERKKWGSLHFERIVLYESFLQKNFPIYKAIAEFPFQPAPQDDTLD